MATTNGRMTSHPAEVRNLEFTLHVITSPVKLNWSTPRGLLLTTFFNHLIRDRAPIGHFFIEFQLPSHCPDSFHPKLVPVISGGKRIITGMSREKMTVFESIRVVQGNRLGLGTFFYDFKGKLDSLEESIDEIEWAKKRNRYASLSVSVSESQALQMLDFLNEWIERGSFRHYCGGFKPDQGEGSACAEFGMHFLAMALGVHAVNPEWVRSVRVPYPLIGGGFAEKHNKVGLWKLFRYGHRWAFGSEPHQVYSVPDPELVFDWAKNHSSRRLIPGEVQWHSGEFTRKEFIVDYPVESLGSVQEQWARIIDKD